MTSTPLSASESASYGALGLLGDGVDRGVTASVHGCIPRRTERVAARELAGAADAAGSGDCIDAWRCRGGATASDVEETWQRPPCSAARPLLLIAAGMVWHERSHEQAFPTCTSTQSESTAQDLVVVRSLNDLDGRIRRAEHMQAAQSASRSASPRAESEAEPTHGAHFALPRPLPHTRPDRSMRRPR